MVNVFNKLVSLMVVISILISPSVVLASTNFDGAMKGDIYNPQTNTISSDKTSITVSNGDVDVEKRIEKVNDGQYNVSFWVKGLKTTSTKTKDTYVVFVIDRSYTMRLNDRWVSATSAVVDMSNELSKVEGINMALVGFSGGKASDSVPYDDTVVLREEFSRNAFTKAEFGNYDTDYEKHGGTNIQAGLLKARDLLEDKVGVKYVILFSDGVPTFYYDDSGNTNGPGNSDTAEKLSQVPMCKDAAIFAASELKKQATIYTVGYDLNGLTNSFTYNGKKYDEKSLALETLSNVASTSSHFYQANTDTTNTIVSELKKIETDILSFPAGYNPGVEDGIGSNFKLVDNSNYGGSKNLVTNDDFTITDSFQKIGDFNINIDIDVDTGWYDTNNGFTLTYKNPAGELALLTSDINPKVYWVNNKESEITNDLDNSNNISEIPLPPKTGIDFESVSYVQQFFIFGILIIIGYLIFRGNML